MGVRSRIALSGVATLTIAAIAIGATLSGATRAPVAQAVGPTATPAPVPTLDIERLASTARQPDPLGQRSVPGRDLPTAPAALTGYVWPLRNARFTQAYGVSKYGTRFSNGQPFHDGIDLATWCGDRVRAAHGGVVLVAGRDYTDWVGYRGNMTDYREVVTRKHLWDDLAIVVVVDDGNGYRSIYVHLSRLKVKAGDVVKAGQVIGAEGATGFATGCHLHYSLFSPLEPSSIEPEPAEVAHMSVPPRLIARIDPLLVLPPFEQGGIRPMPGQSAPPPMP